MQQEIRFGWIQKEIQGHMIFAQDEIGEIISEENDKKSEFWKKHFDYRDGKLFWKRQNGRIHIGHQAGTLCADGYVSVTLKRKTYMVHRIVWEIHHGEIDDLRLVVHHKNKNRSDNRIENLQLTTKSHNSFDSNRKQRKYPRGIYFIQARRATPWLAEIAFEKRKHKKYFYDINSAIDWLNYMGRKLYGTGWINRKLEANP